MKALRGSATEAAHRRISLVPHGFSRRTAPPPRRRGLATGARTR